MCVVLHKSFVWHAISSHVPTSWLMLALSFQSLNAIVDVKKVSTCDYSAHVIWTEAFDILCFFLLFCACGHGLKTDFFSHITAGTLKKNHQVYNLSGCAKPLFCIGLLVTVIMVFLFYNGFSFLLFYFTGKNFIDSLMKDRGQMVLVKDLIPDWCILIWYMAFALWLPLCC